MPLDLSGSSSADIQFIARVIDTEIVYVLASDGGVASSVSSQDDESTVLMFWSNSEKAGQVKSKGFDEFQIEEITLFDFLYRWLPGMAEDAVLVGVNWDDQLVGTEGEALELADAIGEAMPPQLTATYEQQLADFEDEN